MSEEINVRDQVRRVLNKDIDMSALDVQYTLAKEGVAVDPQVVYNIRSKMKAEKRGPKKVKAEKRGPKKVKKPHITLDPNFKSIRQHVLEILQDAGKGLTAGELSNVIRDRGYRSNSENYFEQCRKKLKIMLDNGEIIKDHNGVYSLMSSPLPGMGGRPTSQPQQPAAVNNELTLNGLLEVKALARDFGGITKLRAYLDALEELGKS